MNDFDWGKTFGRLFIAFVVNDDFFGIAIRMAQALDIFEQALGEVEDGKND